MGCQRHRAAKVTLCSKHRYYSPATQSPPSRRLRSEPLQVRAAGHAGSAFCSDWGSLQSRCTHRARLVDARRTRNCREGRASVAGSSASTIASPEGAPWMRETQGTIKLIESNLIANTCACKFDIGCVCGLTDESSCTDGLHKSPQVRRDADCEPLHSRTGKALGHDKGEAR